MGIDLNKPVQYKYASFRYFKKNEHHLVRFCEDNVLLLVYEGVLRFSEDGVQKEVHAGEYYIQEKNHHQAGEIASDSPHYLYVHFDAEWTNEVGTLAPSGRFDFSVLSELMEKIDAAEHENLLYSEKQYLFLKLLLSLNVSPLKSRVAQRFSDYIEKNIYEISSLADLCDAFHYSKNYVIRIFNKEFGVSPIQYINDVKINRAMYLLERTSLPIKDIIEECGYSDYPYFYKRFVRKTGISPLKWRTRKQQNPLQ